jgi:hypothetical protein
MSSFYDDASLVVIPSGYKTSKVYAEKPTDGSGDLTFTRTGDTATRVNSAGLIEKVRTNYARQSQSFATAAAWTATNGTLTNNAGTAPDGTNTASKIVATNTDPFCYQSITLTGPVVASCYLKAVGSAIGKSAEIRAGVSLTAFTLSGSWQRVFVTHTASGAHNYGLEVPNPGVIGDEVLLWGFQVEGGDVATDYIPTTTAAVSVGPTANTARLDYLGSTCPRLLLEPQRTNLVTNSERFTSWLSAGGTVTSNTAISPDGYQNADTLTGARYQSSFASNQYTVSCFAKKVDGDGRFTLRVDVPASNTALFDLNNGTIVSTTAGYTSSITNFGNGWYRCTLTTPASTTINNFVLVSATGATASTYVWGAQCEVGAYATSYIPTLSASATRGADACLKTGISSLIGQTEGVLFVNAVLTHSTGATNEYLAQVNASANNRILIYRQNSTNKLGAILIVGGAVIYSVLTSGAITSTAKVAFAYKSGDFAFYVNGTQVGTSSATYTTPPSMGSFDLDSNGGTENGFYSYNQALLFKTRLTNAELATLTTL